MKKILFLVFLLLQSCSSSDTPELHLFMWADYIKPDIIRRFEKEQNCKIVIDNYDSNEAMYAKLKLGVTGYDLIFPSIYIIDLMLKQGMIEKLDYNLIPNAKFLDSSYTQRLTEKEMQHGIPYMISFTGVGYRSDKLSTPMTSWAIFGDKNYKGRMTMMNDMRETLGACLRYLGFSLNTKNASEVEKAADVLIAWKGNLAKFENEQYKNGLATAEFLISQGYSGDIAQVASENPAIEFAYPKEGTSFSVDLIAIPQKAPNQKLAHAFINYLLRAEIAAENITFTQFLSPNKAAYPLLDDDLRNNPALFPPEEVFKKAELLESIGESIYDYIRAWDRAKAA